MLWDVRCSCVYTASGSRTLMAIGLVSVCSLSDHVRRCLSSYLWRVTGGLCGGGTVLINRVGRGKCQNCGTCNRSPLATAASMGPCDAGGVCGARCLCIQSRWSHADIIDCCARIGRGRISCVHRGVANTSNSSHSAICHRCVKVGKTRASTVGV